MKRESLPTLLALLRATDHLRAGTMTEADRQFIGLLLTGIARDEDVRDYFFQPTPRHRRRGHDPMKECAAMIHAIAEQRGEKMRSKHIQRETGLTRNQVDTAIRVGGEYHTRARASLQAFGPELAELMLQDRLEELRNK